MQSADLVAGRGVVRATAPVGRREWPTEDEFDAAGRRRCGGRSTASAARSGWADELGLDLPRHRRRRPAWTDERIDVQLRQVTAESDR